jgi:trans-aconitate methyltransferase
MTEWYREDLAYIHDVGFRSDVLQAMPGILAMLNHQGIAAGLVVDLGCGSGLSTDVLVQAGYRVLGVDISEAMIAIARQRVPQAMFQVASLLKVDIPNCHAVISIGECFNYLFDPDHPTLIQAFQRIYNALVSGGMLIFDIAEPGQVTVATAIKSFTEGEDWVVLVEKQEDLKQHILTRRIITFRQVGELYRRDDEVHCQQLYRAEAIAMMLQQVGFEVEIQRCYGQFALPQAHAALIARKMKD